MAISKKTIKTIIFQDYRGGGVQHFPRGMGGSNLFQGVQMLIPIDLVIFQGGGSRSAHALVQFNLSGRLFA